MTPSILSRSWAAYLSRTATGVMLMLPSIAMPFTEAESWHLVPEVSLSETYSDISDNSSTLLLAKSGWVTEINPKIHAQGSGGRVKGFLDVNLNYVAYAGQSEFNDTQKTLNGLATIEAVENWFFVDVHASRLQESKSIFGATANDIASANSNRTEATVYQASPYIRGMFSNVAAYQLRLNATDASSTDGTLSDTQATEWVGRINNASASAKLGWSIDGSASSVRSDVIVKKVDDRIYGSLIYEVIPSLHISITSGQESTDYIGPSKQSNSTSGFGLEWSPSTRTQLVAASEKRFFGNGHSLLISHRTGYVALQYKDDKDVSFLPSILATSGQGSIYGLISDLLATSIPDPIARDQAVRAQLASTGNLPYSATSNGILSSRITLNRDREASVALLAPIDTVTFILSQSDQTALSPSLGTVDSFSLSNDIRVQGISLIWKHSLSPLSSISLATERSHSEGMSLANLESTDNSSSLFFSTLLSSKTKMSVGYRRTRFDNSTTGGYLENALVGSIAHRF